MANVFVDYYTNQAGSGLTAFEGYQYQKGHGFFGSIFKNILVPLGRYLGKQFLSSGVNVGNDLLQGGDFKESLIKNAKSASTKMLEDGAKRGAKFIQTGKGRRRRTTVKKRSKKSIKRKTKKVSKTLKKKRSTKKRSKSKFADLF